MRVLVVTGSFPPMKCGVGDYTFHLVNALAERPDVEVGVLTSLSSATPVNSSRVQLFNVMPGWGIGNALQAKRVIAEFQPDVVHIQYPTQGYNNGYLPWLLPMIAFLMGKKVVQTWHEGYRPWYAPWIFLKSIVPGGLVFVRPNYIKENLHTLLSWAIWGKTPVFIPNASTIPVVSLSTEEACHLKQSLSGGRPAVCYFGFAYPNKGIERLFEIADPEKHHLVLICDLSELHPYQAKILQMANQAPWAGKVTVTGFQSAQRVGEILAVADAVVFPFPGGAGEWNTSLKAAESAGAFIIATTRDAKQLGYHETQNIYFAGCGQISEMRDALNRYAGMRRDSVASNPWEQIAMLHEQLYRTLCRAK